VVFDKKTRTGGQKATRLLVATFAGALAVFPAGLAWSAPAFAASPLPAFSLGFPGLRGTSYPTLHLAPGSSWQGNVEISDRPGSAPADLVVYPTDALTAPPTGTAYTDYGQALRPPDATWAAGSWVTLGASEVRLSPGQTTSVPVTINVPAGATPGDHVAGVAAQPTQGASSGSGRLSVIVVPRIVVAVVIDVPGGAPFSLQIGQPSFPSTGQAAVAVLHVPLTNTGGTFAKPTLAVSMTGPNNYSWSAPTAHLDTILPGQEASPAIAWPTSLAPGNYTATVTTTWPGGSATRSFSLDVPVPLAKPKPHETIVPPAPRLGSLLSRIERFISRHILALAVVAGAPLILVLVLVMAVRRRKEGRRRRGGADAPAPGPASTKILEAPGTPLARTRLSRSRYPTAPSPEDDYSLRGGP